MSLVTIILASFIGLLVGAHALLYFWQPMQKRSPLNPEYTGEPELFKVAPRETPGLSDDGIREVSAQDMFTIDSEVKALREKTHMAHNRISEVEELLSKELSRKGLSAAEKHKIAEMHDKLHVLDNFKANTTIELQGVKEIAAEMQAFLKAQRG